MKKKQFNEYAARKHDAEQRSFARKHMRTIRKAGYFSLGNTEHMRRGLQSSAMLRATAFSFFKPRSFFGTKTRHGETTVSTEEQKAIAARHIIDFVRDPYKFNKQTRAGKLTRSENKRLVEKVLHYTKIENIAITRQQIKQIVDCYCSYKPKRNTPVDPFIARMRAELQYTQWVADLARLCLTYVQLGSDFPMWTYYKSGRSFTYGGIDKLAQTVSYNSGVDALARNVKEMAALYKPNLVRGDLGEGPYLRAPVGALDADSANLFVAPVNEGFPLGTHHMQDNGSKFYLSGVAAHQTAEMPHHYLLDEEFGDEAKYSEAGSVKQEPREEVSQEATGAFEKSFTVNLEDPDSVAKGARIARRSLRRL